MEKKRTTEDLADRLLKTHAEDLEQFYLENKEKLMDGDRPFYHYMKERFQEKNLLMQDVFLAADIPERYGYKLITEERHTKQRDVILRLCLAAKFTLTEANRALQTAKMPPLYAKRARDAVWIIAFNEEKWDLGFVEEWLQKYQLAPLGKCGEG